MKKAIVFICSGIMHVFDALMFPIVYLVESLGEWLTDGEDDWDD